MTAHQSHGAPAVASSTSWKPAASNLGSKRAAHLQAEASRPLDMLLPIRHEVLGPGLHRFVFPSESRRGVTHELLLDLHESGPARLSCLCEAALHNQLCKHKRLFILGLERAAALDEAEGAAGA